MLTRIAVAVIASTASSAFAEPNVALVAAAGSSTSFNDVQSKLLATGLFGSVGILDASAGNPTPDQLAQYDAVLVWSNTSFLNAALLGDTLADYVDSGRGVVVAAFATSTTTANRSIAGRFHTGGYEIIPVASGNTTGTATFGTALVPDHPTLAGVSTLRGGTGSYRPTTTALAPHGIKVATWSDGKTLIAASSQFPNRVDLGLYPPSANAVSASWDPTTDGARILANALLATIHTAPPCDPDVNQDGNIDQDDVSYLINVVAGGPNPTGIDPDFTRDGNADQDDISSLINVVAGGACP